MSIRRLEFDIEALCAVAAKAVGTAECSTIGVLAEGESPLASCSKNHRSRSVGGCNRVFLLGMDNGTEVIARNPFKNAGPRRLLTQSEVATMDFARTRLGIPVPKVLAWSASRENSVGSEYIIMEKWSIDTLADQIEAEEATTPDTVMLALANAPAKLASIPFSQYGSLYYKEDVSPELQARPLYAEGHPEDEWSAQFRIGPSVERRFCRAERVRLDVNRGPCKYISSGHRSTATYCIKSRA